MIPGRWRYIMKIRGGITVFASVILSALTAFSGTVIDLARFRAGEMHARAAVQLSVQSALTQYFAPLKDNYGLFAGAYSKEELEVLIHELLEKNLCTENAFIPGITDLFGFSVNNVSVYPVYNLADEQVLEKEITQYMKYRAPINTAGIFVEKLKALSMFLTQSGLLKKRMDLEDRLQKVREEQVYLSLMLSEKISKFLENGKPMKEINDNMADISSLLYEAENLEKYGGEFDRAYQSVISAVESIRNSEAISSVLESEIVMLQHQLETLLLMGAPEETVQDLVNRIWQKQEELNAAMALAEEERNRLRENVDECIGILGEIKDRIEAVYDKLTQIKNIVFNFIRYHEESIELVSAILKNSADIELLSEEIGEEIKKQSEKSDNAFLIKIRADIKKLVLNVDPGLLSLIKTDLEKNLDVLKELYDALESAAVHTGVTLNRIEIYRYKTGQIESTLNYTEKEFFTPELQRHFGVINNKLDFVVTVYRINTYSLEPEINRNEKNEFYTWCNMVFGENYETGNRNKGSEKKLRENIRKADENGIKENEMFFNGKDTLMSDRELDELFRSLPSHKNDIHNSEVFAEEINSEPEEKYKGFLENNTGIASVITDFLSGTGEALLKSVYVNEYIIGAFKNANIDKIPVSRINTYGFPAETFFEKAEVEYIIFGGKKEKTNARLAQLSIFGIRMGLNLIHIYMDSKKTAAALSAALAVSGWTGFGVPIVKNLIILGWAAGESYLDLKDLNNGKDVPVYKTENTWKLGLGSLLSGLAGEFLDRSSDWLKDKSHELTDKADEAVKALVRDLVSGVVHEVFLPLEQAITDAGNAGETSEDIEITVSGSLKQASNMDDIKKLIYELCLEQYRKVKSGVSHWTLAKLEDYKGRLIERITEYITENEAYRNVFAVIRNGLDGIIDESMSVVSEKLKEIGNAVHDQGMQNQLIGTVISFDYVDYLRFLLITVPMKTKLLRTADLIQLNMRETLDNPEFDLSEYNTFLVVEADISMRAVFLPSFLKTEKAGRFRIRWGYGY